LKNTQETETQEPSSTSTSTKQQQQTNIKQQTNKQKPDMCILLFTW
jgi:hypothetical protein